MPDDISRNQTRPITLDYRNPSHNPRPPRRVPIWWAFGILVPLILAAIIIPNLGRVDTGMSPRGICASQLKDLAAGMITYANTHQGAYPASMEELMLSSGMSSAVLVCPESNDTPTTSPAELADLSVGGHCSYVYLGKGLTDQAGSDIVLVYEPLANHKNKGMNVLFGDYHVRWLNAAEAKQLIASIVPGKPTVWPPPAVTQPAKSTATSR